MVRSTFVSKKGKTPHLRTTFGSSDVGKVHAVVARSTCPSQKCKKLRVSDHFLTFRCRRRQRRQQQQQQQQQQQGANKHWDPVLIIYLFLFLPFRVQTNTGTPSLLLGGAPPTTKITYYVPFPAAGPLFVSSAAQNLQKGVPDHRTWHLLPLPLSPQLSKSFKKESPTT